MLTYAICAPLDLIDENNATFGLARIKSLLIYISFDNETYLV